MIKTYSILYKKVIDKDSTMFIDTRKIGAEGLLVKDTLKLDQDLLIEEEGFFVEALDFNVHLSRDGQKIRTRGQLKTVVSLRCVSCLENFEFDVDSNFDLILFPVHLVDENHAALQSSEMEYIFYEGDEIDLEKILMEQINLFIPYNPACSGHCKGICANCGTNLNYEECNCENTFNQNEMNLLFSKLKR
jgi:DUF177 domain-containing protein